MRRAISVALGAVALAITTIAVSLLCVLAVHLPNKSGRTAAQVSVALEVLVAAAFTWLLSIYVFSTVRSWSSRSLGIDYGVTLLTIVFAAAASSVTLVHLSQPHDGQKETILGTNKQSYLAGAAVAIGLAVLVQLIALLYHFVLGRDLDQRFKYPMDSEHDRQMAELKNQTVRSSTYTPDSDSSQWVNSSDSRNPPPSIGGSSRSGTMTSVRTSFTHTIHPVSSRTALMSKTSRSSLRPASMDSSIRRHSGEDAFDSWDTSSVDTQNRLVVMELTAPSQVRGRFLETIPGSPTVSTPSPEVTMPLEPPRARPRSRSYSPASTHRRERPELTSPPSMSELHIHPLFRSDSPTPPPAMTPGTIVVASPNAGQVISDRHSIRSLSQKRISSAPSSSPLSRRDSMDSKKTRDEQNSIAEEPEDDAHSTASSDATITPPIPDWILSAGARTSWTGYNNRKSRSGDGVAPQQ